MRNGSLYHRGAGDGGAVGLGIAGGEVIGSLAVERRPSDNLRLPVPIGHRSNQGQCDSSAINEQCRSLIDRWWASGEDFVPATSNLEAAYSAITC
ncbi:MAG: hypothetical protein IPM82_08050 [Saprospiraceae bacterium]|nr:hypothetical protein [Saprospiraceae bacterium]